MTQEEKAQAFDKALEDIGNYVISLKNVNDGIWSARDIEESLSEIFHGLKEYEAEKVRKKVIDVLSLDISGAESQMQATGQVDREFEIYACKKVIAWLEQKCEQEDPQKLFDIAKHQGYKEGLRDGRAEVWAQIEKQGEQKDVYTKQQLRDMGFAFTLNGDIVTPEKTNEAMKEYLANEKKKWEKEQKPAEWSKEDMSLLNTTILYLNNTKDSCGADCIPYIAKCIEWLKSLRPQKQWKPSEVQVRALECGIDDVRFCNLGKERLPILNELLEQLRALL